MAKFVFRLFLCGQAARNQAMIVSFRRFCETYLHGDYDLDIIDVLEAPEQAEQNRILATPTLMKVQPGPVLRLLGDFSAHDRLCIELDVGDATLNREPVSATDQLHHD